MLVVGWDHEQPTFREQQGVLNEFWEKMMSIPPSHGDYPQSTRMDAIFSYHKQNNTSHGIEQR